MRKKIIVTSLIMSLSLPMMSQDAFAGNAVSSTDNTSSSGSVMAVEDDPNCSKTKAYIDETAKKRIESVKEIQKATTPKAKDFSSIVDSCTNKLGGNFNSPFFGESNVFDGLLDKLCNKGLDILEKNNPITKAVNGIEISDPTGTFSYSPSISLNKSGKRTVTMTKIKDRSKEKLWGAIDEATPNSVWE